MKPSATPETVRLSELTAELPLRYQDATRERYVREADEREARERALRTSRSVIKQGRAVFARKMRRHYAEAGIVIPPNVDAFLSATLDGTQRKSHYHPPPDSVVNAAFDRIDDLRDTDRPVWLGFWMASGAGLRKSEIRRLDWAQIIDRDGRLWISGGIGKDGERIEVPIQVKAAARLALVRKPSGPVIEEGGDKWSRRLNAWLTAQGFATKKKMHELRAYVGSLLYVRSPGAAMRFLRHKSIQVTEQFYARYATLAAVADVL